MEKSPAPEKSAAKALLTRAKKICIIKYTSKKMSNTNFTTIDDVVKKHTSPSNAVSSFTKESEPFFKKTEQATVQEVVEHEPKDAEVKPFVTPKPESIQLPPDLKKMGLETINKTQFPSYQNVKLPISDEEVIKDLKEPPTSTKRWLGELAKYLLLRAHLALKEIGGKVVRIIKY